MKERQEKGGKDCYSLVKEPLSSNPFMTKVMLSKDFTPSAGVTHIDNIQLANSPTCSGGEYKPNNSN